MARTSEIPVLIVGGGAVGCVLSMELARRDVPYRCIERNPGPGRESRAIAMHARTVELLEVGGGVARLRLLGGGHGCPSSAGTLRHAVEEAVLAAAPEVTAVEVEDRVARPEGPPATFIPVEQLLGRMRANGTPFAG